ncbi:hypothetical protein ABDK56_05950 [Sphingomonas sp. ASV193]|uniref:hypothetical protein n=1 Tax=Sphingomonas sp. ASV193 TaxID=3144405 RepID=UPI0032E91799
MRRVILFLSVGLVATPALADVSAQAFTVRVDKLMGQGPLALFSPERHRLQDLAEANGDQLLAERREAIARHEQPAYCPPPGASPYLGARQLVNGLHAMPVAERERMTLKEAMRTLLARLHPCPRAAR